MKIQDYVRYKNILFVPIYSMRDYATGVYRLDNDGNMARIVSKLIELDEYNNATVYIPEVYSGLETIMCQISRYGIQDKVTFKKVKGYGKNAKETRECPWGLLDVIRDEYINGIKYDVIIAEPNFLISKLYPYTKEIIYWNVASVTTEGTPWFVSDYSLLDRNLARKYKTACATMAQVNALQGNAFVESFYRPNYFDYKIIFFPFRISDENYMAKYVRDVISELYFEEGFGNFKVYYTDPNGSNNVFDKSDIFVKVPSQKEVYLGILKGQPIIPYMENTDVLEHISINEFIYYNCNVIMKCPIVPNGAIYPSNFTLIENVSELKQAIIEKLR